MLSHYEYDEPTPPAVKAVVVSLTPDEAEVVENMLSMPVEVLAEIRRANPFVYDLISALEIAR